MEKTLRRSSDRMIAGVAGGFAEYFGIEVTWLRLGIAFATILTGGFPGIILYVACVIIIPN